MTYVEGQVTKRGAWAGPAPVCLDPADVDQERQPTPEEVLQVVRVLLPKGEPLVQPPDGRTLVNLETIFRTEVEDPFTAQVTVVGQPVTVEARPTEFNWHFGDGSDEFSTDKPGRPYPHKDVVHTYQESGEVEVDVDITYEARFRVADGPWVPIPGDIEIIDGPPVTLQVLETGTVLSR